MNVISGTKEGQFEVTFMLRPKPVRKLFPADKPKLILPWMKMMVKKHGQIEAALRSSSMDFPKEYGVTHKQVAALYKALER